jgi:hypothetical protein
MRNGSLTAVVAALVLGVLAASAAAADPVPLTRIHSGAIVGPRVAGDSVFFGQRGSYRVVLRLASVDGSRALAKLPRHSSSSDLDSGEFTSFSSRIAASPNRLEYEEALTSGSDRYQQSLSTLTLYGGGLSGPFGKTDTCSSSNFNSPASASLDADGPRVAFVDCAGRVVVRDHTGPQPIDKVANPGGGLVVAGTLALAGDYVAYNAYPAGPGLPAPSTTEVRNWRTGAKLYEIPRVSHFDLQADGKLASVTSLAASGRCRNGAVDWYSAAQPTAHPIGRACSSDVRIAGDRVLVASTGVDYDRRYIDLLALDGSDPVQVVETGNTRRGGLDFDGQRLAFGIGNCGGGVDVYEMSASAPGGHVQFGLCEVDVLSRSATLGSHSRSVPVRLECQDGCVADLSITMPSRNGTALAGSRRAQVATPDGPIVCSHGTSFGVKLNSAARAELRRRHAVNGHLIVRAHTPDGRVMTDTRRLALRAGSGPDLAAVPC